MGDEARKLQPSAESPPPKFEAAAARAWIIEVHRNAREFAREANRAKVQKYKQDETGSGFLGAKHPVVRHVHVPTGRRGTGPSVFLGIDRRGRAWILTRRPHARQGVYGRLTLGSLRKAGLTGSFDATPTEIRDAFVKALAVGMNNRTR